VQLAVLMGIVLIGGQAGAVGAPAGTPISNTATATFDVGGTPLTANSLPTVVTVDEIIDVTVVEQNSPLAVSPSDTNRVLTFLVTNTGNGTEDFALAVNSAIGTDDFDPAFVNVYLDANSNGSYDAGTDTLYQSGVNDPPLDANGTDSIAVFVLHNIPASPGVGDGDVGQISLTATAVTVNGPAGTVSGGNGDGGVDAVVGTSTAQALDTGDYVVASVSVALSKAWVIVNDPVFGTQPVPGATIRYTITVSVTGAGTADNLLITDGIPANTSYVTGTLTLGGSGLTDGTGDDAGEYDGAAGPNGEVSVDLGNVAGGGADQTITFDALIDPS
jgi:uncharacterized repeat protein (TIGR01451 family)